MLTYKAKLTLTHTEIFTLEVNEDDLPHVILEKLEEEASHIVDNQCFVPDVEVIDHYRSKP